jgi:hypothetical protein
MIISIAGNLGAGKSHTGVEVWLNMLHVSGKFPVTNMAMDLNAMYRYCIKKRYYRLASKVRRRQVFYCTDLKQMLRLEGSIVLADEFGIFANARAFAGDAWKENQGFIYDLVQTRKSGVDIIWIAQHHEMVAKDMRRLTNQYYHMSNFLGRFKICNVFKGAGYEKYLDNPSFKTWFKNVLGGYIKPFDPDMFAIYNTLERPDKTEAIKLHAVTAFGHGVDVDDIEAVRAFGDAPPAVDFRNIGDMIQVAPYVEKTTPVVAPPPKAKRAKG